MSASAPVLLAASAGVGFAHAVLPDHWVPLAVVGRTRRYPVSRVARLSALAGLGHVLLSVVLGAVVIAVGLQLRSEVRSAQNAIVGGLLIVTGLGFLVLQWRDHDHHHHHHDHHHHDGHEPHGVVGLLIPFGAAASPDLTILPVFLAATTAGAATAVGTVLLFAAVTIATFVVLTVVVALGSYQVRAQWLEDWGNAVTGVVLVLIGALVWLGML